MDLTPLVELIRALRHPETGCAWDRAQTLPDLIQPLREEMEELAEAIQAYVVAKEKGMDILSIGESIREEAGDLLFNLMFVLSLAEGEGLLTLEATLQGILNKMRARHPHVFGGVVAKTPEEARAAYLAAKAQTQQP